MRFKYIEYRNDYLGKRVVFGKEDPNVESKFQLVKVDGYTKQATSLFKNETIDSQERIYKGNRLPQRDIMIKFVYQIKETLGKDSSVNWEKKEQDLTGLIRDLATTDIQNSENLGYLTLVTRNDKKYIIKNVSPEEVVESDSSKSSNNYAEATVTFKAYTPYITDGGGTNQQTFDLKSSTVLTDFVDDPMLKAFSNTSLEFELESAVESIEPVEEGIVKAVRDGYISNVGIFYYDGYGQFWLTDSLDAEVNNKGVRFYPKIRINGLVENPRIDNNSTGQSFGLNYIIGSGEYVIVDMENKTVNLYQINDGVEIITDLRGFVTSDSQWIFLQQGINDISISFDSASQDEFGVTMEWETNLEGVMI